MVQLGLKILPHLQGRMHIQTNPSYAYDSDATVAAAERIVALFQRLDPDVGKDRICIKIPSTWEGLQACRVLSAEGIHNLATTLFTIEQAVLAAKMGCTYIAPYVNELAVHFEPGFVDHFPGGDLCVQAQRLFRKRGYQTKVLPASLVSIESCMSLAGIDHITIAPGLLQQLNETTASKVPSAFEGAVPEVDVPDTMGEKQSRLLLTRRDGGRGEIKQVKAINVFADFQVKLEELFVDVHEGRSSTSQ